MIREVTEAKSCRILWASGQFESLCLQEPPLEKGALTVVQGGNDASCEI